MNQDFNNQPQKSNRFIFSDEFYNQLDSTSDEEKVSFDIPEMPSSSTTESVNEEKVEDYQESSSSFFTNIQNNNMNNTIQPIVSEPKVEEIETPSFNFVNPVAQEESQSVDLEKLPEPEVNDTFVNSINMPKEMLEPEIKPIQNTPQEFASLNIASLDETNDDEQTNEINNQFNVETGIDTALEQEILKSKVESQMKAPIVQNNVWLEPEPEKMVYRARRNHQASVMNNSDEEANITSRKIETPRISPLLQPSSNIITEKNINPPIINIDEEIQKEREEQEEIDSLEPEIIVEDNFDADMPIIKSDLLQQLAIKEQQTGKISILARYGEDFCSRDYITNPAIGRTEEIKQLILILLTPEKSAILVGKPGIGKTSIVEGLAYRLQRNTVPDALKGYRIVSVKTTSLLGTLPNGETRLQTMIDELKDLDKIILFIDEVHMLMGATSESSLDFANMFKESLGRGSIKMIGATTNDEYERYVLRDKAFVRRFQRVDVEEPTRDQTIKILMGTLPKIEKNTGAKLKYSNYVQTEIMAFIVDITTEYKRVYGIGSRYPDICLTLLSQAFSQAVFDNRNEVTITDIRNAIANSKNIYPDVIRKELVNFDKKFSQLIKENE